MSITALNLTWRHLSSAKLVRLSADLVQNPRAKDNITDFVWSVVSAGVGSVKRVRGHHVSPVGDTAMHAYSHSGISAKAEVAIVFPLGGPVANTETYIVAFRAWSPTATPSVDVKIRDQNAADLVTGYTQTLTDHWRRYARVLTTTRAATNAYLVLHVGTFDTWLTDVHVWRVEASETLPTFQRVRVSVSSGLAVDLDLDEAADRVHHVSRDKVAVEITQPFIDSDPEWFRDRLRTKGREWTPGEEYLDGDMEETATSYWTDESATLAWSAQYGIAGPHSLEITRASGTTNPRASRALTLTCAGLPYEASAWVKAITSDQVCTCPVCVYDGTTQHRAATVYTLTTGYHVLVRNAFVAGPSATVLTARLLAAATTTHALAYDGVKLDRVAYTPFTRGRAGGLNALLLTYAKATTAFYDVVVGLRLASDQFDGSDGHYLMDEVSAVGEDFIRITQ